MLLLIESKELVITNLYLFFNLSANSINNKGCFSSSNLEQKIITNQNIPIDQLAQLLVGKWFGSFRYISHTEGKQLVIRWQLVDSKSSAILRVLKNTAIINIIPDKNDNQTFSYERSLEELSHYLQDLLTTIGIESFISVEGWNNPTLEIDYQKRLSSWLNTFNQALTEN